MGLSKGGYALLCELISDFPKLGSSIIQLGRQQSFVTAKQFLETRHNFGLLTASERLEGCRNEIVDETTLFQSLGFSAISSIDASRFEDATYVHDLNLPIPTELTRAFDVVYDGGTVEHIFNVPAVLMNIFSLLEEGGVVIHSSPSHNHVDHGFYMFSPMFFYEWYSANKWEILKSYTFEYSSNHNKKPWKVRKYEPGMIDHLNFGGWGSEMLGIWICARKTSSSTCDIVPQQSFYRHQWKEFNNNETQNRDGVSNSRSRFWTVGFLKYVLSRNPVMFRLTVFVYTKIRRVRGKGRIIARY